MDNFSRILLCIARSGPADISYLEMLISRGADVNFQDDLGRSALHYYCFRGFAAGVRLLLDAGADCNIKDNHGNTPLRCTVDGCFEKLMKCNV